MISFATSPARRLAARSADECTTALVMRLVAGDAAALDAIYRAQAGAVYRYALALCGNPAWAADATQEAFVALADRPQGFDASRGTLGAYLAGVARYTLLACFREAGTHVPLEDPEDGRAGPLPPAAEPVSPEVLMVREQASAQLWEALRALPWAFREALVLVDLQDRPYAEAAAIAGIELNTLRTRLHRARLRLASLLTEAGEAP